MAVEFVIGFFVALLIGLTGVGAGIVTTPLLIVLLGLDPVVAVGTALLFSAVVKAYTGLLYALRGLYDRGILLLLLSGGIPGVLIGSYGISFFPISRDLILVILGGIVLVSALMNLYFSVRKIRPLHLSADRIRWVLPLLSFLIGVEVGFSSVGAGVLVELLLLSVTSLGVPSVIGTSLIFGSVISILGGTVHLSLGNFHTGVLTGLFVGGAVGSLIAAKVIHLLPQQALRYALLSFLVLLGGVLIGKGVHL